MDRPVKMLQETQPKLVTDEKIAAGIKEKCATAGTEGTVEKCSQSEGDAISENKKPTPRQRKRKAPEDKKAKNQNDKNTTPKPARARRATKKTAEILSELSLDEEHLARISLSRLDDPTYKDKQYKSNLSCLPFDVLCGEFNKPAAPHPPSGNDFPDQQRPAEGDYPRFPYNSHPQPPKRYVRPFYYGRETRISARQLIRRNRENYRIATKLVNFEGVSDNAIKRLIGTITWWVECGYTTKEMEIANNGIYQKYAILISMVLHRKRLRKKQQ